jgi:hypothetical protein
MLVYQRVSLTYFATLVPSKATCSHRSSPVAGHGGIAAQRRQGGGALGAEGRYVRAAQGGRPGDRIRPEDRDRNPGGLTWFLVGGFHVWFPCQTHCDILYIYTGWWFGTMEFYDFPYIGNVIIPTDFHIFQRGWSRQPGLNHWKCRKRGKLMVSPVPKKMRVEARLTNRVKDLK